MIAAVEAPQGVGPRRAAAVAAPLPLRRQIFDCIRAEGQIARSAIAKQLDISPATVTTIVADLIAEGLLAEVDDSPRAQGRGRPPVALRVRPEAGLVIGLKLADTSHTGAIVDFAGTIVAQASLPRRAALRDTGAVVDEAAALADRLLAEAGLGRGDVAAVGLGVPGVVDHAAGRALWSPILRERDVPLAALVSERLGLPTVVDNDANLVTLAELWFGAGRDMSDFAVVTIEHGVGMGLVIDQQLYRGAHSVGLELGHTKVQLDGALCRCGQRGCLEAYVADYALVREAFTALEIRPEAAASPETVLESLFDQAKAGHDGARTIFRRAGRFLALGLANVVNLFDPSLIILSGERMRFDYLYADEVMAEMRRLALGAAPPVEINTWGGEVWARGAAALALGSIGEAHRPAAAVPA